MKIGQYTGLKLGDREAAPVTDEELESFLNYALQDCDFYDEKQGVANEGDKVVLDIVTTSADGKEEHPFDENFSYLVGSHKFEPVEEKLLGVNIGDKFDFEMPVISSTDQIADENHEMALFHCTVLRIESKIDVQFSDELAKNLGYKDLEDLRNQVRGRIQEQKQDEKDDESATKLLMNIVNNSEVIINQDKLDEFEKFLMDSELENIKQNNLTKEKFLEINKLTEEQFNDGIHQMAKQLTKSDAVINEIARLEHISISEDELDQRIQEYMKQNEVQIEDIDEKVQAYIEEQALREKIRLFLLANND